MSPRRTRISEHRIPRHITHNPHQPLPQTHQTLRIPINQTQNSSTHTLKLTNTPSTQNPHHLLTHTTHIPRLQHTRTHPPQHTHTHIRSTPPPVTPIRKRPQQRRRPQIRGIPRPITQIHRLTPHLLQQQSSRHHRPRNPLQHPRIHTRMTKMRTHMRQPTRHRRMSPTPRRTQRIHIPTNPHQQRPQTHMQTTTRTTTDSTSIATVAVVIGGVDGVDGRQSLNMPAQTTHRHQTLHHHQRPIQPTPRTPLPLPLPMNEQRHIPTPRHERHPTSQTPTHNTQPTRHHGPFRTGHYRGAHTKLHSHHRVQVDNPSPSAQNLSTRPRTRLDP